MLPPVAELTAHPERLNKESLYGLRELVARYPYYQAARLLLLQNLFILHDASFGEELRKAALFVPDRKVLFRMVEGETYEIRAGSSAHTSELESGNGGDRTVTLIDRFLDSEIGEEELISRRKPTVADVSTDYVAYLLQMEDAVPENKTGDGRQKGDRSGDLIEEYISRDDERLSLSDNPEYTPDIPSEDRNNEEEEGYFTETLAKIYIKQGRYEKAMEIIRKIHLNYPKKNRYFADQIRFLQKLIINQKSNTKRNV